MSIKSIGWLGAAAALIAGGASAHHSFAMFDNQKSVTLEGTITEFQWLNPHVFVRIAVKDKPDVEPVVWTIEGVGVITLKHQGWTRNSLKPGDKAVMVIHPLRSADPGGSLVKISVNGKVIGAPQNVGPYAATGEGQ